jgi:thiaminase/transcriptional activator TenA
MIKKKEYMTNQKWSQIAWEAITEIYKKITDHQFLVELLNGKLPENKFLFYIEQDALYLEDFSKVLAGVAIKSVCQDDVQTFISLAGDNIAVEKDLHNSFLQGRRFAGNPTPSCLLYTSFLHRQLLLAPLEEILATVLPCFWIYQKVGEYLLSCKSTQGNPYQKWIDTYGGMEYGQSVDKAKGITDRLAEQASPKTRNRMTEAFVMASKMEYMFWDSAFNLESWTV